jgi:hypothetical protein
MKFLFLLTIIATAMLSFGQGSFKKTTFEVTKVKTVSPRSLESDFNINIKHIEAPLPGGSSYRSFLAEQKIKAKAYYAAKSYASIPQKNTVNKNLSPPIITNSFEPRRYFSNGNSLAIPAGIPSDNTLAISNDGVLMTAMNTVVYAYDINTDSTLFENTTISLRLFAEGLSSSFYYDPKLYYDPLHDRFILAILKDFDPANSEVIICFSSSNDPNDEWYVYELPGNPLENNRWTDFPCIAITDDKLYFTANLIIPDVSWQVGFDGSIIWEMELEKGYQGAKMDPVLYHDITYNGNYTRNLHPVQDAEGVANELFLLSNRNFDIENDTIFLLHLVDGNLSVEAYKTDIPYGVPPNARQQNTDTSDPTSGLQTNDARVLGAYILDNQIQFVGNTMNPETGFSAIYHGIIDNVYSSPVIKGHIIGDSIKDYGYPNIAWSSVEECERESIIAFNYSSFDHFPGMATLNFNKHGQYSPVITIKEGGNWVNRLPGSYERWGDYYGLQRKYNAPGEVYSFGFYAFPNQSNGGYIAYLKSPDSTEILLETELQTGNSGCDMRLLVNTFNAIAPIEISSISNHSVNGNALTGICAGDTVLFYVTDARGCTKEGSVVIPIASLADGINVFPNPTMDWIAYQFNVPADASVTTRIYNEMGQLVLENAGMKAKAGLNEFSMSLAPLAAGNYVIVLLNNNIKIEQFKVVKQ